MDAKAIASPGIYVASRASVPARPEMWKRMRSEGWPIISSWIDEAGPGETSSMRDLWSRIHAEISASSLLLMYVEESDLPLKGAYVEAGIALALGRPILVVSTCDIGSWTNHPQVSVVPVMPSLPEALAICERYRKHSLTAAYLRAQDLLGDERLKEAQEYAAENSSFRGHRIVGALLAEIRRLQAEVKTASQGGIDSGSPEAEARDRIAERGFAQYEREFADLRAQLQIAERERHQAAGQLVIARQDLSEADKETDKLEQQLQTVTTALVAAREDGERLRKALTACMPQIRKCGSANCDDEGHKYCPFGMATAALSAAAEPQPYGPSDRDPECDISGQCCASENATGVTNCIHCGKELHQRANGCWYTWDAPADGGLPQSQIVKAKSVAEPQAEHPDTGCDDDHLFTDSEVRAIRDGLQVIDAARSAGEKGPDNAA